MAIFTSKFFQMAQSTEPKLFVSSATVNCLITGVIGSYDGTVPIKVRHMLLLNSLLDFAYNNAINRDLLHEIVRLKNLIFAQPSYI